MTVADRKEALDVAVKWASKGRSGVKIIGDGRLISGRGWQRTSAGAPRTLCAL
jgi:hypothetical protein